MSSYADYKINIFYFSVMELVNFWGLFKVKQKIYIFLHLWSFERILKNILNKLNLKLSLTMIFVSNLI